MTVLIDYQKESKLPFVRRMINPVDKSMRDLEADAVYPELQFPYFQNTLMMAKEPNVNSYFGLILIPVPVSQQMSAGLDEELSKRIPITPLGKIIKQYMMEPPDESRLIHLSPSMPGVYAIARFKDMKREGISLEFDQNTLELSKLPEIERLMLKQ